MFFYLLQKRLITLYYCTIYQRTPTQFVLFVCQIICVRTVHALQQQFYKTSKQKTFGKPSS